MRVAFVTVGDVTRLTGGYLYHRRVFDRLAECGIEVEEVVPSGASADEQKTGTANLAAFDPRGYDAVVVDMLARVVVAPFVREWRRHRPVVAMVHELPSLASPEGDAGEERGFEEALLDANLLVAVSEHGKSLLEGRGVPAKSVRVVSPGFDGFAENDVALRVFHGSPSGAARRDEPSRGVVPEGEPLRRKTRRRSVSSTGVPARFGGLRALCVAQWIPRKGILELVEAWRMADVPNASLELVGETDADPEYRSRVMEAIGGESSILASGKLDDGSLATAYAESDVFVLPSRFEGYGVVYAEALSFGLPVVACDVGPVPEVVGAEAGVFVEPGDVEGVANSISTLLADEDLRLRMSDAALCRAGELPRWDDTARGFAGVLREAVGDG